MSLVALARRRLAALDVGRGTRLGTRLEHPERSNCSMSARQCSTVPDPAFGTVEHPPTSADAALPDINGGGWREGLANLSIIAPPPGMSPRRWERVRADAGALGETWAVTALALGWREVDLWGCNPYPSARRLDRNGLAMLLGGRSVAAFTDTVASILCRGGNRLSYYRAPLAGAVLLWEAALKVADTNKARNASSFKIGVKEYGTIK